MKPIHEMSEQELITLSRLVAQYLELPDAFGIFGVCAGDVERCEQMLEKEALAEAVRLINSDVDEEK